MASFEDFDDDRDQIYVSGLPTDITEQQLADHFGQIGMIKLDKKKRPPAPKIWIYKDKATGEPKGDATVTYEDPFAAHQAPTWFDGKEFLGKTIHVSLSEKPGSSYGGRGGGGYGTDDRYGKGGSERDRYGSAGAGRPSSGDGRYSGSSGRGNGREGDWVCAGCGNNCFGWRDKCNRCNAPKPVGGGEPAPSTHGQGPPARGGPGGRAGDWSCPGCGNNCFGWRDRCNRCSASRPDGISGGGAPEGSKVTAAPQGPPGLFTADDWPCPACGNVNWARRTTCNQCNAPKPGTMDLSREGAGGGFKELDQAEVEEARRRRREREENEEYDEFGRRRRGHDRSSTKDREYRDREYRDREHSRRDRSRSPRSRRDRY